jgi:hypothetical protein
MLIRIYKIAGLALALSSVVLPDIMDIIAHAGNTRVPGSMDMIDIHATEARLRDHLKALTVDIGERSPAQGRTDRGHAVPGDGRLHLQRTELSVLPVPADVLRLSQGRQLYRHRGQL